MTELSAAKKMEGTKIAQVFRHLFRSEYQALLLCALWFLFSLPFTPELASANNLTNIFSNLLPLLIVATGQTIVLLTGGIDLSATSIMALTSVSGALVMTSEKFSAGGVATTLAGLAIMILLGAFVGALNGTAIAKLAMPPFMVTLTTMMFFSGLAIWLTKSKTIYGMPSSFTIIGQGALVFVPYALLVALLVIGVLQLLLQRTLWGRWIYALGHNNQAARVAGVPVERTIILTYIISGVCAACAAILYTGRLETGSPVLGQRLLLDVIGAAVIGGTSLFGGKGKIFWTISGALFLTLIDNTLNLAGRSHFEIMMVKGIVILFAALLDLRRSH